MAEIKKVSQTTNTGAQGAVQHRHHTQHANSTNASNRPFSRPTHGAGNHSHTTSEHMHQRQSLPIDVKEVYNGYEICTMKMFQREMWRIRKEDTKAIVQLHLIREIERKLHIHFNSIETGKQIIDVLVTPPNADTTEDVEQATETK